MQISALTGENVESAFSQLATACLHPPCNMQVVDFIITLSATLDNNIARLVCTNIAGEELKTLEVSNADCTPWSEIHPKLAPASLSDRQRPRFILPDGSLATEA